MECSTSVRVRLLQLLMLASWMLAAGDGLAETAVVLVTGSESPIEDISSLDIRKAYLGTPVHIGGYSVRAFRQGGDEQLNNIFLQSVMAMSQKSYERRLLSLVIKFATPRPTVVNSNDELVDLLVRYPSSIAYMWKRDAKADPRVKIVRTLWQEV
jgi:hypothetical protein